MPRAKAREVKDAIGLLKEDHTKVRALLGELEKSSEKATARREELLEEIERRFQNPAASFLGLRGRPRHRVALVLEHVQK